MTDNSSSQQKAFQWPEGKRAAISLTFDDARLSQIDTGIPILDSHGVKATFYVSLWGVKERRDGWKQAVANGHETGNHTISHPCGANYGFDCDNLLEDYTLERMEKEMLGANDEIERLLGVRPTTFAYPCGQTFVGRGEGCQSYVPLVARHFLAGRGGFDETPNDPTLADLAQLAGMEADGANLEQLKGLTGRALERGKWLVLFAHEVSTGTGQTLNVDTLDAFCRYLQNPANGVWVDTVANIAASVLDARKRAGKA